MIVDDIWDGMIAAMKSASEKEVMSLPIASMTSPTVSRISVSRVTLPLRIGSVSSWSMLSTFLPPVAFGLYAIPAKPDCHGIE